MRKSMKKWIALLLTMMMILGLAATAQAAALSADASKKVTSTAAVTITNSNPAAEAAAKQITFHAYQIVYGEYDSSSNSLVYKLTEWAKTALVTEDVNTVIGSTNVPAGTGEAPTTAIQQNDVLNRLAAAKPAAADDTWTGSSNAATISHNLPLGVYLVTASAEDMSFLNMMVSVDTTATEGTAADAWVLQATGAVLKGRPLAVDKEITNEGLADNKQIGDTVNYTITADVPHFPANAVNTVYKIIDTPTNLAIKLDTVKVYGVNAGKETKLAESTYTAGIDSETGALTVDFSSTYKAVFCNNADNSYKYDSVKITYDATLLTSAVLEDGNENTVKMVYGNNPYSTGTSTDEVDGPTPKIYTYGVKITKLGEGTNEKLSNTIFHLTDASGNVLKFLKDANGVYKLAANQNDTTATADLQTGADNPEAVGTLLLAGLDEGKAYVLSEAKAPAGYSLNENTLTVTISAAKDTNNEQTGAIASVAMIEKNGANEVQKVTVSAGNSNAAGSGSWNCTVSAGQGYFEVSLKDTKLPGLPETGGMGTMVFTVAGVALMILALFLVFAAKRKNADQK